MENTILKICIALTVLGAVGGGAYYATQHNKLEVKLELPAAAPGGLSEEGRIRKAREGIGDASKLPSVRHSKVTTPKDVNTQ